MADEIVNFTFNNDALTDSAGNQAILSGNVQIDFTTGAAAGNFAISSSSATNSFSSTGTFSGSSLVSNQGGSYTLSSSGLQVTFNGYTPTAGSFSYTETTNVPSIGPNGTITETPTVVDTFSAASAPIISNAVSTGPVCFTTGTLIRTARGDVAVEQLRIGDRAITASGSARPIVWLGHRNLQVNAGMLPHDQHPIRILTGAFGRGADGAAVPARDMRLSPGHPILVGADSDGDGGHLVPIMCLINGTSVRREPVSTVTYWHVELDSHDILVADGLAAESYLDWGDRPFFAESSDHALHNPDHVAPGLKARCRPVAVDGPAVEAERARLDAVFTSSLEASCAWSPEAFGAVA